jgi:hypothetical protein
MPTEIRGLDRLTSPSTAGLPLRAIPVSCLISAACSGASVNREATAPSAQLLEQQRQEQKRQKAEAAQHNAEERRLASRTVALAAVKNDASTVHTMKDFPIASFDLRDFFKPKGIDPRDLVRLGFINDISPPGGYRLAAPSRGLEEIPPLLLAEEQREVSVRGGHSRGSPREACRCLRTSTPTRVVLPVMS